MKVPIKWLEDEFVKPQVPIDNYVNDLSYKTIGIKEVTPDHFELDMKGYNRADLLSLRGVAYEISALNESPVLFEEEKEYIWEKDNYPNLKIDIQTPLVPVYALAKIDNLKVTPSKTEDLEKLQAAGFRGVNNLVDITNLVMLEYGQPLHAFSAEKVNNEHIIVRETSTAEKITTLDHKKRILEKGDIVIADQMKVLGIAGVMGGEESEITQSTTSILLEAAIFDPVHLRKTSNRLGLHSEASKRFYHGLTKRRLMQALNSAIKRYLSLGGKLTQISLYDHLDEQENIIELNLSHVRTLIGVHISDEKIENFLTRLRFDVKKTKPEVWEIKVPYFRLDILREEDLIEEIARLFDYRNIIGNGANIINFDQTKINTLKDPNSKEDVDHEFLYNLKQALAEEGLIEIQTYHFFSSDVINHFSWDRNHLVKISNPISKETKYLREDIWPNLLEIAAKNLKFRDRISIFEIGKTYLSQRFLPVERYHVSLLLTDSSSEPMERLFELFKKVAKKMNLNFEFKSETPKNYPLEYFHPVKSMLLTLNDKKSGFIAEIHPRQTDKFHVNKRVAVLELEI